MYSLKLLVLISFLSKAEKGCPLACKQQMRMLLLVHAE